MAGSLLERAFFNHRIVVLVACLLVTLLLGFQATKLKLNADFEKMIPTAGPIVRTKKTGPHIVALIGPTGVGKTTTLAKLAANLKLREKHRVGPITLECCTR